MASLNAILPKPKHDYAVLGGGARAGVEEVKPVQAKRIPSYGRRKGFRPIRPADFGNGGAFPELHFRQYPRGMGRKSARKTGTSNALVVSSTSSGTEVGEADLSSAIVRQRMRPDQVAYTRYEDMVEKRVDRESLVRPADDKEKETVEATRKALEQALSKKRAAADPRERVYDTSAANGQLQSEFLRYTPHSRLGNDAQTRVVQVQELQRDPMEPSRFKHNKLPQQPASPPVPVLRSPARKLTKEDMENWRIPPCISKWKNNRGHMISLDKRLISDGAHLVDHSMNDRHGQLAQAMYAVEEAARDELERRRQIEEQLRRRRIAQDEEELLAEAQSLAHGRMGGPDEADFVSAEEQRQADEREQMRQEMRRDLRRDLKMEEAKARAGGRAVGRQRDISERVALGQQLSSGDASQLRGEGLFDQRVFGRDGGGLSSGFGTDESHEVYDRPMVDQKKFERGGQFSVTRGDEEQKRNDAFMDELVRQREGRKPDVGFKGADEAARSSAPVQFEKEAAEERPPPPRRRRSRSRSRDRDRRRRHSRSRSRSRHRRRRR